MNKPEILKKVTSEPGAAFYDGTIYDGEVGSIFDAMDEYAKQQAKSFLSWYAMKVDNALYYIKEISPITRSKEMEEAIEKHEGKSMDDLFTLYESEQLKNQSNEQP